MKTTSFRFFLAALAATAALVGCTKEITPNFENDKVNPEGSRIIAVSFAPQTKTTLDGFQPKFEDGKDTVLISNTNALDTCVVSVKDNKATISTNLTGSLTAVYPYKAAKMSEGNENEIDTVLVSTVQSGKFADANICMAKMTDEKDESLSFDNKTAVFCIYPPTDNPEYVEVSADGFDIANDGSAGSTRTIHVATTTADSVYVSILVPEGLKVSDLSFSDGVNEKTVTTGARADEIIAAGTLYTVTATNWGSPEADIPEPLKGVFTVSDGGTPTDTTDDIKVRFSKGNLVATINEGGTPTAWKFHEHQYDTLGCDGANKKIGQNGGDVDLFGWSTDATYNNWGIHTKKKATKDYTTGNFKDWGKAIGDGNTWCTLSKDEWTYLINKNGDENIRKGKYKYGVTVCGKTNCLILVPDECLNGYSFDSAKTDYNEGEWAKAEAAGLVCLPAAGGRLGSGVSDVGGNGCYWSSTANGDPLAYYVYFNSGIVGPDNCAYRYGGYSVRLVTNVSAAPAPTPTEPDYVVMKMGTGETAYTRKWATKNLGAEKVATDYRCYGDYYQWGSVEKLYTSITWTGNTTGSFVGLKTDGFAETNLTYKDNADLSDATNDVVMKTYPGTNWRMPTKQEFQDLYNACVNDSYDTDTYASAETVCGESVTIEEKGVYWCANYDGVAGVLFYDGTNVLFFPAAGYGDGADLYDAGDGSNYWSSSLYTGGTDYAYSLYFLNSLVNPQSNDFRYYGFSVRPVSD